MCWMSSRLGSLGRTAAGAADGRCGAGKCAERGFVLQPLSIAPPLFNSVDG